MNDAKVRAKPKRVETRPLHVPKELHKRIVLVAAHRDENVQTVATQALLAGLPTLDLTPQSASN